MRYNAPYMTPPDLFPQAQKQLKSVFGYDALYPTQEKAIRSILSGHDTFVLMPTGGGKSLCYQLPALVLDGLTVVISPLISLMKDQVDGLRANGVSAAFLNSTLDSAQQATIIAELEAGTLKILYVSAERLVSAEFMRLLKTLSVSLFAVDEAHCISSWGHDFRPDYTNIAQLRTLFPEVPMIALTATADRTTRADILTQLEMHDAHEYVDSFDRPNITLSVEPALDRVTKIKQFIAERPNQPGIIYCMTRKQTESLATKLHSEGITAASYHAGMSAPERERVQRSFVRDKTQIICATIAFGMGIDKSNVRWVIHYNIPKNLEGYYQEIGRAGRDGAPAEALLFYTYADIEMIKKIAIDAGQSALQLSKLTRMKEYAESVVCRRQVLLRYFDEAYTKECDNCDICADPYPTKDGTRLARAVLTAAKKKPTQKDLAGVLSRKSDAVGYASWQFYIAQLKNLGLIRVDFEHDQRLTLTSVGEDVLRQKKKLKLVPLEAFVERQAARPSKKKSAPKRPKLDKSSAEYADPLFARLRELRLEIAKREALPPYIIFSDATLLEMVRERPQTRAEMLEISGVGEIKWEKYGAAFVAEIGESSS